jgi:anti-anti-sigma factor
MGFHGKMHAENGVATIWLFGEVDSRSAHRLNELIVDAVSGTPERLVLLAEELTYLSSAGLRSLVFAHQKMRQDAEIVLVGVRPEVAETIRLTGFDRSIVMQEAGDAQ